MTRPLTQLVELARTGRIDEAGDLIADGFVREDRRIVVSMPTAHGRDDYLASVRAIFDAGFTDITYEPLAVRGDRLMLTRAAFRTDDGDESDFSRSRRSTTPVGSCA